MQKQCHQFADLPSPHAMIKWGCVVGLITIFIGMLSIWMAIPAWLFVGWTIQREGMGIPTYLWHSVPNNSIAIDSHWGNSTNKIVIHIINNDHAWSQSALILWGLTGVGVLCLPFGIFPVVPLLGLVIITTILNRSAHKPETDSSTVQHSEDSVQIVILHSRTWKPVYNFLKQHESVLPNEGTIVLPKTNKLQQFSPPAPFDQWAVQTLSLES